MSELQNDIPQQQPFIRQDLLDMADKLEHLQEEQQEGGVVDKTLEALNDRRVVATIDLANMETELAEKEAAKRELQKEVTDVASKIGNDDTIIDKSSPNRNERRSDRGEILIERIRACYYEISTLTDEITTLKARIDASSEDVHKDQNYQDQLHERPKHIAEALGYIALANDALNRVVEVRPVPPLFADTYRYEPIIGATDLSEFITFGDNNAAQYASIPVEVPPPQPIIIESPEDPIPSRPILTAVPISDKLAKRYLQSKTKKSK